MTSRPRRPQFLMLIATSSFDMDDRLRKECESIRDDLGDVSIVGFEATATGPRIGEIAAGIPFSGLRHFSKAIFRPGKALPLKALETTLRLLFWILRVRPNVVWLHDPAFWPAVRICLVLRRLRVVEKVVWDLHELIPDRNLKGPFAGTVKSCLEGVDLLVLTNRWRFEHLQSVLRFEAKSLVFLENYPSRDVLDKSNRRLPESVEGWLNGREFIVGQGAAGKDRNFTQLKAAVEALGEPLILIGKCPGGLDSDLFLCTGWIPQEEVYAYLNRAMLSVILYERADPNALYCSPNRLFQAIARYCPVLVGNNPPLAKVVGDSECGHILADDGSDSDALAEGIRHSLANADRFRAAAASVRERFIWEKQFGEQVADIRRLLT